MPKVNVPGVGVVNFPDTMSRQEILQKSAELSAKGQPARIASLQTPKTEPDQIREGMLETSSTAQMAESPLAALKGLGETVVQGITSPSKLAASMLEEMIRRPTERFAQMKVTDDPLTQAAGGVSTALSALPVVGSMVGPAERNIPTDPSQPVNYERLGGNVAGVALDAAMAKGGEKLVGGVVARRAASAERTATAAAAKPALKAMQEEVGRVPAMNQALGVTKAHVKRAGGSPDSSYSPAQAVIDEGLEPNLPRPQLRKAIMDRLSVYQLAKNVELDQMGDIATPADVRGLASTLKTEMGKLGRSAKAPRSAFKDIIGELNDIAKIADRQGGTISAREWHDTIIRDKIDTWMKLNKGEGKTPVRDALKKIRTDANARLLKNPRIAEMNPRLANLAQARRAIDESVLADKAARPGPPMPEPEAPTGMREAAVSAGRAVSRLPLIGTPVRTGARTMAELLALMGKKE